MTNKEVGIAEAKKHFSELIGRVAYGGERIIISKRGKPMAIMVPATKDQAPDHLSKTRGWLEEDDPFFDTIDKIIRDRMTHTPRMLSTPES